MTSTETKSFTTTDDWKLKTSAIIKNSKDDIYWRSDCEGILGREGIFVPRDDIYFQLLNHRNEFSNLLLLSHFV